MYKFKLPIGDWSDDGHGKCDYYIISSNVEPEKLVPIYVELTKKYPLGDICGEYEEYQISDEQIKWIEEVGLVKGNYTYPNENSTSTRKLAQLVIDMLMKWDVTLQLEIINDDIPEFNNWFGQKVMGGVSVIDLPGYGLF